MEAAYKGTIVQQSQSFSLKDRDIENTMQLGMIYQDIAFIAASNSLGGLMLGDVVYGSAINKSAFIQDVELGPATEHEVVLTHTVTHTATQAYN